MLLRLILALKGCIRGTHAITPDASLSSRGILAPLVPRPVYIQTHTTETSDPSVGAPNITPHHVEIESIGTPGQAGLAVETTLQLSGETPLLSPRTYEIGKRKPSTSRHRLTYWYIHGVGLMSGSAV